MTRVSTLGHWWLMARVAAVLLSVKALLRVAPAWTIRTASRRTLSCGSGAETIERLTHAVNAFGRRRFLTSNCLSRSITVLVLARREGLTPTLVIGARRAGRQLDAHAWLECGGVTIPQEETGEYARLLGAS